MIKKNLLRLTNRNKRSNQTAKNKQMSVDNFINNMNNMKYSSEVTFNSNIIIVEVVE